jgi:NAD-dependent deacetylase
MDFMMGYQNIVILTGAGVSAESGIKTFRAANGLWEEHRVEEVASLQGFMDKPELVQRFYNQRRKQLLSEDIQPNAAHYALADFQEKSVARVTLVTQNIDNLHERAGSHNVIHMHGELLKMFCVQCRTVFTIQGDIESDSSCDSCSKSGTLRPDIVWFGEVPYHMDEIIDGLSRCDLFLSIGTSGAVYPAANFVALASQVGAHTVEINLEPSYTHSHFKEKKYGKAGEVLPQYLQGLLG